MSAILKAPLPRFRPMQSEDLDRVAEIERQVYEFPWSRGIFGDCLRVGYSCWVMQLDGAIAGYGVVSSGAGEAHILNLCIAPEYQHQGYGRRLLNRLLDLARWYHARSVFLEVRPSNHRAIRMYETLGFACVGRRPNYYPAQQGREDALIMVLKREADDPGEPPDDRSRSR